MGRLSIPGHDRPRPREVELGEIRDVLGDCGLCPLAQSRERIVFGRGSAHARLMLIGEAPCMKDMSETTNHDFQVVNLISIFAIFVIIALVEKSLTLPVILIEVIEAVRSRTLAVP